MAQALDRGLGILMVQEKAPARGHWWALGWVLSSALEMEAALALGSGPLKGLVKEAATARARVETWARAMAPQLVLDLEGATGMRWEQDLVHTWAPK